MNHPSIPKTSLDVTSANHGILAVWRTIEKNGSLPRQARDVFLEVFPDRRLPPVGGSQFLRRRHFRDDPLDPLLDIRQDLLRCRLIPASGRDGDQRLVLITVSG